MSLLSWFLRSGFSEAEVRAGIWSLGIRHVGWPLDGMLDELKSDDLSAERILLLRACVEKLQRGHG